MGRTLDSSSDSEAKSAQPYLFLGVCFLLLGWRFVQEHSRSKHPNLPAPPKNSSYLTPDTPSGVLLTGRDLSTCLSVWLQARL